MKKIINMMALMGLTISAFAQSGGTISGKIKDGGNQKVIDAASISLLRSVDSSLVKTSIADSTGGFYFENVKDGSYLVVANSIGHSRTYSPVVSISDQMRSANVGTIQLIAQNNDLKEVVVVSKRPLIERKIDRTVINVDAAITNTGTTAMEVLEKSPGVSVDKDGNISLKGKQGVIVMIDGKQSFLSGAELANFLNNLPSSNLDQIEIMLNPSAKYDAAGNAGIINLKTKKNKQKGFNGSLSAAYGQGVYPKTNNSLNLNYRSGKFNFFSTLSGNYRRNFQELNITRNYTYDDKTPKATFKQETDARKHNRNFNAKLGADYYASKKTTIGLVFTGYLVNGGEIGSSTSYLLNHVGVVDSIVAAKRFEDYKWNNGSVNFNVRHSFDSTGRELTADLDYLQYHAPKDQRFENGIYNPNWSLRNKEFLIGDLPSDVTIYSAKVDYVHPFKSGLKIETGIKSSYVTTDNDARYFNEVNGVKYIDWDKTNHFVFKENINAAYINFSKTIKKWGLQAGLRAEQTNNNGKQFGNPDPDHRDSSFNNHYIGLFPTAYVSYDVNKKNQFGFSYGRRINRPDYEDLNPFLFFLDKFTYGEGNPFLRPMYSDVFELLHTYNQFLTTTLNYNHTKDLFTETFRQSNKPEDSLSSIVIHDNYGVMNNLSIAVNAQIKIAKWYTTMIYGEARYQEFKGVVNTKYLDIQNRNFLVNINNQFSFDKGWSGELSGFYTSKNTDGQMTIKPVSQVDLGIKKEILKMKGSVKVSLRDMFGPMRIHGKVDFQNTYATFNQSRDSRVVTVSFNYRFGKPIKGIQKRKTGGAGDEQNRVKGAN